MATENFSPLANANVRLYRAESDAVWADARNAATATGEQAAGNLNITTEYEVDRIGLTFDTSSIPNNADISSAIIKIYPTAVTDTDSSDIDVVSVSASDPTNYAVADFAIANWGSTVWGNISLSTLNSNLNALNSITLDSNGIANIDTTGNSAFGLRNSRDTDNSAPTGDNNVALTSGSTVLNVTYTVPASAGPMFFSGGGLGVA